MLLAQLLRLSQQYLQVYVAERHDDRWAQLEKSGAVSAGVADPGSTQEEAAEDEHVDNVELELDVQPEVVKEKNEAEGVAKVAKTGDEGSWAVWAVGAVASSPLAVEL